MDDKYENFRKANYFFEFDSLKLITKANTFKTDFERIQFFENVKMEFDIGSDFCKSHINLIKKRKKYLIEFEFQEKKYPNDNPPPELYLKNIFTADLSWQKFFYNEKDYTFFVNSLHNFFSGSKYDHLNGIKLKNKSISKFITILHDLYFNCSTTKCLKKDKNFLLLIKSLPSFSNLKIERIYYRLTHA